MLGILHLVWYLAPHPLGLTGLSPALGSSLLSGPQFCSENRAPVSSKHREGAGRLHSLESVQVCRFDGPGL